MATSFGLAIAAPPDHLLFGVGFDGAAWEPTTLQSGANLKPNVKMRGYLQSVRRCFYGANLAMQRPV